MPAGIEADVAEHGEAPEPRKRVECRVVAEVAVPEAVSSREMPVFGVGEVDEEVAVGTEGLQPEPNTGCRLARASLVCGVRRRHVLRSS